MLGPLYFSQAESPILEISKIKGATKKVRSDRECKIVNSSWCTYQLSVPIVITGSSCGIEAHAKVPKQLPAETSAPFSKHAAVGSSMLLVSEVDIL